jgi:Sap, sulfolipid-1-addressing protein
MAILIPTIIGLALLDALNPFSIAALVYLLGASRPIRDGLLFSAGTYFSYLLGGLLLLAGWQSVLNLVAPIFPWWSLAALEIVGGTGLLLIGVWLWKKSQSGTAFAPPRGLGWFSILAFAVTSTIADLSSAIPYFGAVNVLLLEGSLSYLDRALYLALYCVFYCSPLIVMVGARVFFHQQSDAMFFAVRTGVDWAFSKLTAPVTSIAGIIVLLDGVRRLWFIL